MKLESFEAKFGLDRQATADEIGTALGLFEEIDANNAGDISMEIPSDCGGYVRITVKELNFLSKIEDGNQVAG